MTADLADMREPTERGRSGVTRCERPGAQEAANPASRALSSPPGALADLAYMRELPCDHRDPDPTKPGIFRDHNCYRCRDGALPCVRGEARRCEFPRARND